jgi:hypothetical protein
MSEKLIGQEILAYCGKCKIDTHHLITTLNDNKIERVMCKICLGYHRYKPATADGELPKIKAPKVAKAIPSPKRVSMPKTSKAKKDKLTLLLDTIDESSVVKYQIDLNYNIDAKINHLKFGVGIVMDIIDKQKISVLFRDGQRMLVQNIKN